ncbi:MAG: T9SS type A sorting domain-containing protein [Bacteroidia bacterium]
MKKVYSILLSFLLPVISSAQITITNADLPSSGDQIQFSQAAITTPVDLTLTGTSYLWDFSMLQHTSQDVDTFLSVLSTPLIYALVFGFNSNQAKRGIDLSAVPQVPISDVYGFYNKSSNNYKQTGYGASITGLTTPISFNNDDIIYDFPITFGNMDSSDSDYSIIIPGLATAIGSQHRVNVVDGWGDITTPYGTFNALRIVSTLTGEDSIYLDTLGFGFGLPRALTREYKWLSTGQDIPILQINTTELLGIETVTLIKYRDSLRVPVSVQEIRVEDLQLSLSPNPSNGTEVYLNSIAEKNTELNCAIYSLDGRLIHQQPLSIQSGQQKIKLGSDDFILSAGSYVVYLSNSSSSSSIKLVVQN